MGPRAALAIVIVAFPLATDAQSYRCVGKDGRKYYGQTIPPQCIDVPVEQLSAQGIVLRRIDPPADPGKRAQADAERAKLRAEETAFKEGTRRDKALLATYASEAEIEQARKRALDENAIALREIEARIDALAKRRADLAREMEFYQGRNRPPAYLEQGIRDVEINLKAQEDFRSARKAEAAAINVRFDESRKRFRELTGLSPGAPRIAPRIEKGVTVVTPAPSARDRERNERAARSRAEEDRMELEKREKDRMRQESDAQARNREYQRQLETERLQREQERSARQQTEAQWEAERRQRQEESDDFWESARERQQMQREMERERTERDSRSSPSNERGEPRGRDGRSGNRK